jgi:hypothetical protein
MIAISNNDTTGRWPVKAPYPLPERYCRTTESLLFTEIYIPREWEYLEKSQGEQMIANYKELPNGMLPILR